MKKKDGKQKLFEMMEKVNPDFKNKINENYNINDFNEDQNKVFWNLYNEVGDSSWNKRVGDGYVSHTELAKQWTEELKKNPAFDSMDPKKLFDILERELYMERKRKLSKSNR